MIADPLPVRFAALKVKDCRTYLGGGALAMMADNIEHVITYWVLWEVFESPALLAFQVISHWAPFLLGSVHAGALADKYDCRRVIQIAQALFMAVSIGWGVLFWTDTLTMAWACVLLVLHGMAGALWGPAEQMMLHDFVDVRALPSAVRLNATARSMGILFGPVVGSALLLGFGATGGIFLNVLIYLPLTLFLFRTKFTGHTRDISAPPVRMTFRAAAVVLRDTWRNPVLMAMIVLGGMGSFFIGASLQTVMPSFANLLGTGSEGLTYGVLLFAAGAGGVVGGLLLEVVRFIRPTVPAAIVSTLVYGASTLWFALTGSYVIAVVMLFIGGVANLAAMSISQTVVQLMAPADTRGQVIGVYGMAASGLRIGSGFTVGLFAEAVGIQAALAISSGALCVGTFLLVAVIRGRRRGEGARVASPDPVPSPREDL